MPISWRGPTALLIIGALSLVSGTTSAEATATDTRLNDPSRDVVVGDDEFTKQMETTVEACGGTVVAAWIDIDDDQRTSASRIGFANSTDGGATWTDRGTVPAPPSAGGGDPPGTTTGDPVLAADAACDFYLTF